MAETTYLIQSRPPVRAFVIAALCALVGAGVAVYGIACVVTGAYRLSDLRALLRRKKAS